MVNKNTKVNKIRKENEEKLALTKHAFVSKFLAYVIKKKFLTEDIKDKVEFNVFNKALENKKMIKWLEIEKSKNIKITNFNKAQEANLKVFCIYFTNNKVSVNNDINGNKIEGLIKKLEKLKTKQPNKNKGAVKPKAVKKLKTPIKAKTAPKSKANTLKTNTQSKQKTKVPTPKGIFSDILDKHTEDDYLVYWELKNNDFKKSPVLMIAGIRILLEEVIRDYFKDNGEEWNSKKPLWNNIQAAIENQKTTGSSKGEYESIIKEMNDIKFVENLNGAIHHSKTMDKKNFQKTWDCANRIINFILNTK